MRRIAAANSNAKRAAPNWWWGIGIGAIGIALLALVVSPANSREATAGPACPFTIDFAGLPAGTILAEQYADQGVHISGVARLGLPDALIVFDTNAPPTHDPDLAVDIGNIAIFAKHLTDVEPPPSGDGLVDDPDENDVGGTATFAFDQDVSIGSVKWIDKDHVVDNFVVAYDAAGNVITSVPVPLGANASVQTIAVNADGVRRLEFVYQESGGFTGIEVDCEQGTPTPTATSVVDTATPTAPAETPTPTPAAETPTPTPDAGTPTPTPPPAESPSPSPTVAAAVATPATAGTSVAAGVEGGAEALPAGGGPQTAAKGPLQWAAALAALALVLGGSVYSMRRERR
jgi:hypothetical protein